MNTNKPAKSSKPPHSGKPKPSASRLLAFDLITQVNREGAYANIRLPQLLSDSELELRDKAFATELSYGTLRMQGRYDFAIRKKIDRPFDEIEPKIIDLLRLGCHQIFEMRVPLHAAVGETVELARKVVGESKTAYVNALLRAISNDEEIFSELGESELSGDLTALSNAYSHPEWIISSYHDAIRNWDEVKRVLAFNNVPAAPHLVAWRGKSTPADLLEVGGELLPYVSGGVIAASQPLDYPQIRNRSAGVQDLGSQLVSEIFYATKNLGSANRWLDMCAGPGGKAAWVYNALATEEPESEFFANEPWEHRAELVARVIPRNRILSFDGRESTLFPGTFDRILIDAPCTGLGALRRRPEARWRRVQSDLKELVALQRKLIDSAVELLNPGGVLAYSTCSPHLSETTGQVLDALHRHKNLSLLNIADFHELPPEALNPNGTMQLWSHKHNSDAMFLALFQKRA
ncbi:MAG: transcription antitermination factor NusB [Actinomycetes bacterium]